jgi:uncharacterized protein (DUF2141 family)
MKQTINSIFISSTLIFAISCGAQAQFKKLNQLKDRPATSQNDPNSVYRAEADKKKNTEVSRETELDAPSDNGNIPAEPNGEIKEVNLVKVSIDITQKRNTSGNICLSVFNKAEGWPDSAEAAIIKKCFPANTDPSSLSIAVEPNSQIAIAIFHDENLNGDLDKAPGIGIPKEGFGFSTNPPLKIGAPSFEEVALSIGETEVSTQIKLTYLL